MLNKNLFHTIPEAIEDIANGKIVIVVDDENRENEGDFVMAADKVTPETINFMATYGRGLICTPIPKAWADRLGLRNMSPENNSAHETAFTISIDARENITTGISSHDRYETIKILASPFAKAENFVRPGHIFPLVAKDGGVIERPGHTEAAVDLSLLAGCQPAGIICEIMNDDGSMARRDDLIELAKLHGLKIITIDELIRYRRLMEGGIELELSIPFPNKYADDFELHLFKDKFTGVEYTAITRGLKLPLAQEQATLVRVHSECFTGDLFGSHRCDCGEQLETAMKNIAESTSGVLIYLNQEGRGIGLANKIRAYKLQDEGFDTIEANHQLGFDADNRDFTPAAMMLRELGVEKIKIMTNNPQKTQTLLSYGIEVEDTIRLEPSITEANKNYLMTKKHKMGHTLFLDKFVQ